MSEDRNASGPRLLHLGCGLTAPEGWTNVDGSLNAWLAQRPWLKSVGAALRVVPRDKAAVPWPANILIADLRKPLPFPDASFDAVYSSHTIEHLHREAALRLLREAWRVLRPGGRCRTLVPDLRKIVDGYVAGRATDVDGKPVTTAVAAKENGQSGAAAAPAAQVPDPARAMLSRLMMRPETRPRGGMLYRAYRSASDFHDHKWMYDGPSLSALMGEAGFVECRERGFLDTEIPRLDQVELRARYDDGVAVEGRK